VVGLVVCVMMPPKYPDSLSACRVPGTFAGNGVVVTATVPVVWTASGEE